MIIVRLFGLLRIKEKRLQSAEALKNDITYNVLQRTELLQKRYQMTEKDYMRRAIELAKRGVGWTSPNPMVGAVIVKDDRVIGEGWHHVYGDLHAERDALKNCREDPAGATIYVTLEPCCHHGKQPPCVDAIIEAGIRKVVMGSGDPNPLVAGKGIQILREHGIEVIEGVLEEECKEFNDVFFYYITKKIPFVAMKYAMTMDGKIACYTGESKWVTGEQAREHVQTLRNRYRGIMVGVGTVLKDDPLLNCRMENGRHPVRIICDSHLRTPLDSRIIKTANEYETILATCSEDEIRKSKYTEKGVSVLTLPGADKRVDIAALLQELGKRSIDSVLVEGGAQLNWSVLQTGLVNKVYCYIAPKIFGGEDAKSPVAGQGFPTPSAAVLLKSPKVTALGDDLLIESSIL